MNLLKDHIDYLKDNPKGYWFKRKLYGLGWTPATKKGWLVLFAYLASVIGTAVYSEKNPGILSGDEVAAILCLATITFLAVVWKTGQPLRWQWGAKQND